MSASKDPTESIDANALEDDETAPTVSDDADDTLTRDDVFHILQCRRRRLVLKYLQEHDAPAKMTDITEHIAAVEHDTTVAALRSQERQRVYIALYQSHLPKLDEEGVIEYQQNRGVVDRTDRTDRFDKYLDGEPSMREDDADERPPTDRADGGPVRGRETAAHQASGRRWSHSYAGGLGFALALAASLYANLPNTPLPPGVGIAIAAITVFALVAARTMRGGDDAPDE